MNLEGTAGKLKEIKTTLMGDGSVKSIFGSSLFMAAAAVYLLMCILFQSWVQPFIIMFTVPLATFGGFIGLAVVHYMSSQDRYMPVQNLDVLTILGFIILAGVVVNNAILIVAQTNNLMKGVDDTGNEVEPLPVRQAIAEAVQSRVRPIFMSMMTSIGGMLPLVITPGSGSELYRGLGAVIVGGMIFSTLFTLLLVPVLMSLVFGIQEKLTGRSTLAAKTVMAGIIFLLAGCTSQPNTPDLKETVKTPQKWQQPQLPVAKGNLDEWWESFNDPKLVKLIEKARKNNSDIAIGVQKYFQALALIKGKEAELLPTTYADGSITRSRFSNNLKDSFQSLEAVNDVRAGISSSWEIDFFGRVKDSVEASRLNALARKEDLANLHIIISSEVARTYYKYLSYKHQENIARKNIKLQEENLEFINARVEAGEATELEINDAKSLIALSKANLESIRKKSETQLNALSLLCGEVPGTIHSDLLKSGKLPEINKVLNAGLPADVIRNRPDIRAAELSVAEAAYSLNVAEKEYFPKFTLNGSLGLNSSYLKDFLNRGSRTYSFGPSFEWRILDAGKISSEVKQQKAVLNENVEAYRKTVLTAFREVEDSMIDFKQEKARQKFLQERLSTADKSLELAKALYGEGLRDYQTLNTALISKQEAEQDLIINMEYSILAAINLYKSLGGGK